ncbi:MAG TPA: 2,3-bisphosphoglycerate-independent phosphoglycerate mutase, partial [Candidatus Limnocylindria bacterium]|nr:2,3-bisphosphoglycerate-independent phosphoglycerate mutase [Candidatus Limnocylindria bacterium]
HQCGITRMYIHPFLDGRDTPPQSATTYLTQLSQELGKRTYGSIGSLQGRWYAMDRSSNWDRTEQSYKMLTSTQATPRLTWQEVLKTNYAAGITDEFIPPTRLDPNSTLGPGDGIIFINTRADRARQLTAAFVDPAFDTFPTQKLNLSFFMTPVFYGQHLATTILYPTKQLANTLKQVLAAADNTIFTIAETEKYAHVTYFFDGGSEQPVAHETRVLVPSLPLKDYSQAPCMSAPEITDAVIKSLTTNPCDFYLINYANADMVGHSGNFEATVAAIECLDTELQKLYALVVEKLDGTLIITADHGNAEEKWDKKHNQPRTAHTNNPVPFLVLSKHATPLPPLEGLADIAPYILQCMSLPIPAEMKK